MSNLPADRLTQAPPFTQVGLDVFGPWSVCAHRTRGGLSESKRWVVMFTCLVTRAVHMEVVQSLSASSFINALRKFTAIRGPAKLFHLNRGTNFFACKELITPEDAELKVLPQRPKLYLGLQSPTRIPYGESVGKNDRSSLAYPRWLVAQGAFL